MAKAILGFFGGASILLGMAILVFGYERRNEVGNIIVLIAGCSFLVAGAPLLGFARVIELLERIAANTGARSVEQSVSLPTAPMPPVEQKPILQPAPRPGRHTTAEINRQATYRGRSYDVHTDGVVVAAADGRPATWSSEAAFRAWADQFPAQV